MRGLLFAVLLPFAGTLPTVSADPPAAVSAVIDRLREAGLDRAWLSHIDVDSSFGRVVDVQVAIDSKRTITRYVVSYGGTTVERVYTEMVAGQPVSKVATEIDGARREIFSELDLGPRGTPYGIDGAKAAADLRVEVLAAEGHQGVVTEEVLPRITLFALTDQYVVTALDAETGAELWSTRAGKRNAATSQLAVTADHVVVINGMDIYCLDATNGRELWHRHSIHAPGAGAAITNWFVYVPMINGSIEAFPLERPDGQSEQLRFTGRAMTRPLLTSERIVWASDDNILFIASRGARVSPVEFRVNFDSQIATDMTTDGDHMIYVPMSDGVIHAINDRQGKLIWKQTLGDPIRRPPVYVDGDLFAVTIAGNLHSIDAATGTTKWQIAGIERFVAASATKVYGLNRQGVLHAFERTTGRSEGSVDLNEANLTVTNTGSDRIYIGTTSGRIECLHELGSPRTVLHGDYELVPNRPSTETAPEAPAGPRRTVTEPPATTPASSPDPFGVRR